MVCIRAFRSKGREYFGVVKTFREKGKVKQNVIYYIGDQKKLTSFLTERATSAEFFSADLENLLYQTPVSLWKLMEEMTLQKILSEHFKRKDWGVKAATAACVMILNYATDRQSKCRLGDWYAQTYLPHLLKIPASKMNKDLLCRTMDFFTEENIYDIHSEVFKTANEKYHLSGDILFYDTTAVTFEGNKCSLAERGYNAAHKYNVQVNIGLATTRERFPVMHKVFEGGTKDVSTLEKVMPLLEKTGNLEKTVFIVDRGITSQANIDLIKSKKAKFIFGKPKDKKISASISSLKDEDFKELKKGEAWVLFYETTHGEDRLLVYWSKTLQEDNQKLREKRLKKISEVLSKLAKNVEEYTEQKLYEKIGLICGKTYRRFFEIKFENGKLTFSQKQDQLNLADRTEGRYAILTNTDLAPEEVLKRYRDRNFVEMSFKDMKLFVNVGPPRHWKDRRVLAHIFLAILAMALRSVLELKIRNAGLQMTTEEALVQLNRVRALVCKGKVLKLTGTSEEVDKIVSAIER